MIDEDIGYDDYDLMRMGINPVSNVEREANRIAKEKRDRERRERNLRARQRELAAERRRIERERLEAEAQARRKRSDARIARGKFNHRAKNGPTVFRGLNRVLWSAWGYFHDDNYSTLKERR